MNRRSSPWLITIVLASFAVSAGATANAAEGDPIAITRNADESYRIESMWNLAVTVRPGQSTVTLEMLDVDPTQADFTLASAHKHVVDLRSAADTPSHRADFCFDRAPNSSEMIWQAWDENADPLPSAIRIRLIDDAGAYSSLVVVTVDGVNIATPVGEATVTEQQSSTVTAADIDVLLLLSEQSIAANAAATVQLIQSINPPPLVVFGAADSRSAQSSVWRSELDTGEVINVEGSTFAWSSSLIDNATTKRFVRLANQPVELPQEVVELIEAKERATQASAKVFAELSAGQMNFRPSNGTHTPRWNTEHMMGRELLFFSQIYAAQDPALTVIDLNPKQMPPDYVAAHPEWSGAEEARQMLRVSRFTRRFSYLLNGLALDEQAPNSQWTLRALLAQMERHYDEHTANVRKKFELADWPSE